MPESFVQVSPDSSGKKIRNESLDMPQGDGTTQTVQMQIVRLSEDDRGILKEISLSLQRVVAALLLQTTNIEIDDLDALIEDF